MALYRKYRPASFAEVVGQSQVTDPLSVALDAGRINHAYLFSGPRGCGKTSSARILARSLNCVEGPTSTPCGKCESCRALAPGGPGNLDVTELDAASHNGVDDMRELRDRAYYAPAESRYRIFIIDEAHMISQQGFNALLKIVEEPPEHLIFIFATTEPEKVIGTIRSRTHNYPFRLLTPPAMKGLLQRVVAEESVTVDDAVYPLIMQAGGGSPRDSLSILDQLLAGAKGGELTYDQAAPLLGVTDLRLIDRVIEVLASDEKGELFRIIHDVINAGHEPRRFTHDLLDRLRDLLVIDAVPGAFDDGLVTAPTDRVPVLQEQASWFQASELTHYASVVNERIPQMRGATSPQLLLEILCAHLLTAPSASAGAGLKAGTDSSSSVESDSSRPRGAAAALAAVSSNSQATIQSSSTPSEGDAPKAADHVGAKPAPQPQSDPEPRAGTEPEPGVETEPEPRAQQGPEQVAPEQPAEAAQEATESEHWPAESEPATPAESTAEAKPAAEPEPTGEPAAEPASPVQPEPPTSPEHTADTAGAATGSDLVETIRSQWAKIRAEVGKRNRVAEVMLTEAKVLGLDGDTIVLGHNTGALAERINSQRNNDDIVAVMAQAAQQQVQVRCVVGTDPKAAGINSQAKPTSQPPQAGQQTWQPDQPQRESAADAESERPAPAARAPEPAKPEHNNDWQAVAAAATQRARERARDSQSSTFSDGVPLPPEPSGEDSPGEHTSTDNQVNAESSPASASPDPASPAPEPQARPAESEQETTPTAHNETPSAPDEAQSADSVAAALEILEKELGARPL